MYNQCFYFFILIAGIAACNQNDSSKFDKSNYIEKYSNGKVKTETKQVDSETSSIKEYFPDGVLKFEGTLVNGKLNGMGKLYNNNGKIANEGTWISGKKSGLFKYYEPDGRLTKIIEFLPFRDTITDRPNQVFKIGKNGDTLLNGQSLFYEYWVVKDTIKMNKEEYQFKIVLKGQIFNNALLRVCDFDEKFNLQPKGHCDEVPFDKRFVVITALTANRYKLGINTLRGEIINYDKFKTVDGRDTVRTVSVYFSRDFYVVQ
jgi:hypothetical protein